MIYADYEFYENEYLVGRKAAISAADFPYFARKASQVIKQYTFDNLDENKPICENVQLCCCELAESYFKSEKKADEVKSIKSQKTADCSITYEDAAERERDLKGKEHDAVYRWLLGTGLLYRGC